jgi:hypothetical protein
MISITISIEECIAVCWFTDTLVPSDCTLTYILLILLILVFKKPDLYRLLTFQVQNLMSTFVW